MFFLNKKTNQWFVTKEINSRKHRSGCKLGVRVANIIPLGYLSGDQKASGFKTTSIVAGYFLQFEGEIHAKTATEI